MIDAGKRRHVVSVHRPQGSLDGRGHDQSETMVYQSLSAEVRTLTSREQETARQLYAFATHEVRVPTDPTRPIKQTDWLMLGRRRLEVGSVNDPRQDGTEAVLLCGEVADG